MDPAHTPIVYLEGGGSGFFSKNCQQKLIDANFHPDDFGSHAHTLSRVQAAKAKCKQWRDMSPEERAANQHLQPTPHDLHLSQCTAGHLVHGATHYRPGTRGGKKDPCDVQVAGFLYGQAPCAAYPTASVEALSGDMEQDVSRTRGSGSPYTLEDRREDEDARIDACTARQKSAYGEAVSAGAAKYNTDDPGVTDLEGVEPKDPTVADPIDGESAEDCIKKFRDKAYEAMQTEAVEREIAKCKEHEGREEEYEEELRQAEERRDEVLRQSSAARQRGDHAEAARLKAQAQAMYQETMSDVSVRLRYARNGARYRQCLENYHQPNVAAGTATTGVVL